MLVGKKAPEFKLTVAPGDGSDNFHEVSLKDYSGKWLVVMFYPRDFTFVWPTELKALDEASGKLKKEGFEILGVSTDSEYSHNAWLKSDTLGNLNYDLGADTKQEVSKAFEIYDEEIGAAIRGTYIIDPSGIVRYQVVHSLGVGRSTPELVRVALALKSAALCPADWQEGDEFLG